MFRLNSRSQPSPKIPHTDLWKYTLFSAQIVTWDTFPSNQDMDTFTWLPQLPCQMVKYTDSNEFGYSDHIL